MKKESSWSTVKPRARSVSGSIYGWPAPPDFTEEFAQPSDDLEGESKRIHDELRRKLEKLSYFGSKGFIVENEEEEPINEEEEVTINAIELADHYAEEELKRTIQNFDPEVHFEEYDQVYQKHLQLIRSFKRIKN